MDSRMHKSLQYRPDIDGLRAVAVLLVISFHAFPKSVPFGFIGVDIFFVISGYLIGGIITLNLQNGSFSFRNFYSRRILRLFPALGVLLAALLSAGLFLLTPPELSLLAKHAIAGSLFGENFLLWTETGYFDQAALSKPLLNLWSLGIEEQFYLVIPFLMYWLYQTNKRLAWLFATLFFIFLLSFMANIWIVHKSSSAAFYLPVSRFFELLSGVLLRMGEYLHPFSTATGSRKGWVRPKYLPPMAFLLAVILLAVSAFAINPGRAYPGWHALLPLLSACLFIFSGPDNLLSCVILCNRIAIYTGKISYPLYLWHWPLLSLAYIYYGHFNFPAASKFFLVLLAFVFAILTYQFVEKPVRHKRVFGNYSVSAAIAPIILVVFASLFIIHGKGLPDRGNFRQMMEATNLFVRPPYANDACWKYVGVKKGAIGYCLYEDLGEDETVAIIGDSHAWISHYGMAALGKERQEEGKGFNTLTLDRLEMSAPEKKFEANIERMARILEKKPEIKKVFLVTRGMLYITGIDNRIDNNRNLNNPQAGLGVENFTGRLIKIIDRVKGMGKEIIVVAENPELDHDPRTAITRAFNGSKWNLERLKLKKKDVLDWQKPNFKALEIVRKETGAKILSSIDAFCPGEDCLVLDESGLPLFLDDDHVSVEGSKFQAKKIMAPALE